MLERSLEIVELCDRHAHVWMHGNGSPLRDSVDDILERRERLMWGQRKSRRLAEQLTEGGDRPRILAEPGPGFAVFVGERVQIKR